MKKKMVLMIMGLVILSSFTGCNSKRILDDKPISTESSSSTVDNERFVPVYKTYKIGRVLYNVYYDKYTEIIYLSASHLNYSGMTTLYNKDRLPMNLEEFEAQQ